MIFQLKPSLILGQNPLLKVLLHAQLEKMTFLGETARALSHPRAASDGERTPPSVEGDVPACEESKTLFHPCAEFVEATAEQ